MKKNDTPSKPGAYGIAAWGGQDDKFVLLYDAFDIWKIDPIGKEMPENITKITGETIQLLSGTSTPIQKSFLLSQKMFCSYRHLTIKAKKVVFILLNNKAEIH